MLVTAEQNPAETSYKSKQLNSKRPMTPHPSLSICVLLSVGQVSSNTYYLDLNTLKTSPGPQLQQKRRTFGCTSYKNVVIVGGGMEAYNFFASTEILDLSKPKPSWTFGKKINPET